MATQEAISHEQLSIAHDGRHIKQGFSGEGWLEGNMLLRKGVGAVWEEG